MEEALRSDPRPGTQYEGHYHLGLVFRQAGRETEARRAFAVAEGLARTTPAP